MTTARRPLTPESLFPIASSYTLPPNEMPSNSCSHNGIWDSCVRVMIGGLTTATTAHYRLTILFPYSLSNISSAAPDCNSTQRAKTVMDRKCAVKHGNKCGENTVLPVYPTIAESMLTKLPDGSCSFPLTKTSPHDVPRFREPSGPDSNGMACSWLRPSQHNWSRYRHQCRAGPSAKAGGPQSCWCCIRRWRPRW